MDHPKSKRQTPVDYSPYYIRTYLYYYSIYARTVTTSMSHASPVAVGESAPVVFTILPTIPMGEYIATGSTLHVVQCRVCGTHAPTVREAWCVPIATQHIYQPARKTQNCSTVWGLMNSVLKRMPITTRYRCNNYCTIGYSLINAYMNIELLVNVYQNI